MRKKLTVLAMLTVVVCWGANGAWASEHGEKAEVKAAIVLASFGTTVPETLSAITNIQEEVQKAFPGTPVRHTFTSNIIRSVWRKRQAEAQKWLDQGIPEEVLCVKNVIATLGDLLEEGYRDIVVQPTHIFFMEQSHDLNQYVRALAGIQTMKPRWRPFGKLVMGRPALGMPGDRYPYREDLEAVLKTLAPDAAMARQENALLVYMAHGNDHWSAGIYGEAQQMMREMYPDVTTFVGCVEGFPGVDDLVRQMAPLTPGRMVLKPLMIVAGDHALNDMAGEDPDSWKNVFEGKGFRVTPVMKGLGLNDDFARIFVDHIRDAARDAGIVLK